MSIPLTIPDDWTPAQALAVYDKRVFDLVKDFGTSSPQNRSDSIFDNSALVPTTDFAIYRGSLSRLPPQHRKLVAAAARHGERMIDALQEARVKCPEHGVVTTTVKPWWARYDLQLIELLKEERTTTFVVDDDVTF